MKPHCLLLVLLLWAPTLSAQHEDIRLQLERIILYDTEVSLEDTPGFVVGLIDRDSTFIFEFGKEADSDSTLSDQSIFEIGSISKTLTASLCASLANQGLLDLDSPANAYLPTLYQNPRLEQLTLRHLLQHTSGFPKRPSFFGRKNHDIQDPYAYYSKADLLEFYSEYLTVSPIGTFRYSHTNYGLLEIIIEAATQLDYEQALAKYLLHPLGMNSTFVALPENILEVTAGLDRRGKAVEPWTFNSFAASEGVKSSLDDIVKFVRAHIRPDGQLHTTLQATHTAAGIETYNPRSDVSMGWHIIKSKKWYNILTHSGHTSGHHCYIACVPETQTGVVVLSNSVMGTEDLSFLFLRMINYNWDRKS